MDIRLVDIKYVEQLKESQGSGVFRVWWQGRECVLKVYHSYTPSSTRPEGREVDLFKCESRVYRHLKSRGLCQRGYIPDFYGIIEQLDPRDWQPHLRNFPKDSIRPNAVLLEYIPNLRRIDLSTFSKERISKLRVILTEIHEANVCHSDPYPRNMMVQEGPNRVVWIDFDHAQILLPDTMTIWQQQWMEDENEMMDYFVDALAADYEEGKISRTWECYYH